MRGISMALPSDLRHVKITKTKLKTKEVADIAQFECFLLSHNSRSENTPLKVAPVSKIKFEEFISKRA